MMIFFFKVSLLFILKIDDWFDLFPKRGYGMVEFP